MPVRLGRFVALRSDGRERRERRGGVSGQRQCLGVKPVTDASVHQDGDVEQITKFVVLFENDACALPFFDHGKTALLAECACHIVERGEGCV